LRARGIQPEVVVPLLDEQRILAACNGSTCQENRESQKENLPVTGEDSHVATRLARADAHHARHDSPTSRVRAATRLALPPQGLSVRNDSDAATLVEWLALAKATEVQRRLAAGGLGAKAGAEPKIIVAADTIVYRDRVLGKPKDEAEALEMLMSLCDATHTVYSGYVLLDSEQDMPPVLGGEQDMTSVIMAPPAKLAAPPVLGSERTRVRFGRYSRAQALAYIRAEKPFDKAGSYAIQGSWRRWVVSIDGDYNNVVGLPTRVMDELLALLRGASR
jgi:septum formation protein